MKTIGFTSECNKNQDYYSTQHESMVEREMNTKKIIAHLAVKIKIEIVSTNLLCYKSDLW